MGLFDGKAKQDAAENEIMYRLSQVPLLDLLIANIFEGDVEPWIQMGQDYYDNCQRLVRIEPDGFEIIWSSVRDEIVVGNDGQRRVQRVEEVKGSVGYSYTKSGYMPLHGFAYDNGKKEISTQRVCCLWAAVVRERMAARLPNCWFSGVSENATFTYTVPALSFKDWF